MFEELNASLANLEAQSNELSAVADSISEALDHAETKLSNLSFQLEFWLNRPSLTSGTFTESKRAGELGRCDVKQLGFAKIGGKWQLCIRSITEITHRESDHLEEVSTFSMQVDPNCTPLHKASRLIRVKAYNALPKFLDEYTSMIKKLVEDAKSQTAPCMFSDPEGYKKHMQASLIEAG